MPVCVSDGCQDGAPAAYVSCLHTVCLSCIGKPTIHCSECNADRKTAWALPLSKAATALPVCMMCGKQASNPEFQCVECGSMCDNCRDYYHVNPPPTFHPFKNHKIVKKQSPLVVLAATASGLCGNCRTKPGTRACLPHGRLLCADCACTAHCRLLKADEVQAEISTDVVKMSSLEPVKKLAAEASQAVDALLSSALSTSDRLKEWDTAAHQAKVSATVANSRILDKLLDAKLAVAAADFRRELNVCIEDAEEAFTKAIEFMGTSPEEEREDLNGAISTARDKARMKETVKRALDGSDSSQTFLDKATAQQTAEGHNVFPANIQENMKNHMGEARAAVAADPDAHPCKDPEKQRRLAEAGAPPSKCPRLEAKKPSPPQLGDPEDAPDNFWEVTSKDELLGDLPCTVCMRDDTLFGTEDKKVPAGKADDPDELFISCFTCGYAVHKACTIPLWAQKIESVGDKRTCAGCIDAPKLAWLDKFEEGVCFRRRDVYAKLGDADKKGLFECILLMSHLVSRAPDSIIQKLGLDGTSVLSLRRAVSRLELTDSAALKAQLRQILNPARYKPQTRSRAMCDWAKDMLA